MTDIAGRKTKQSLAQARAAAAAAVANIEFTEASRFFAAMDIPFISSKTFKQRYNHGKICRKKYGVMLADKNSIIAQATWDEAWTHRRNAQDCVGTLMVRGHEPNSKPKIVATAIVSRNNIDTPVRDSDGNWMIASRGDQNFYGTSSAMAGKC